MTVTPIRLIDPSPTSALARLRQAEAAMTSELVSLREAIAQVKAALLVPHTGSSLLTIVEAARELRVSRSKIFDLLTKGELHSIRIGRSRCIPRRSLEDLLARLGAA